MPSLHPWGLCVTCAELRNVGGGALNLDSAVVETVESELDGAAPGLVLGPGPRVWTSQ